MKKKIYGQAALLFALCFGGSFYYAAFSPKANPSPSEPIASPYHACSFPVEPAPSHALTADTTLHYPEEKHLANIRQLTFGGDNAEAYFSYDSKQLILQVTNPKLNAACDQIFKGKIPRKKNQTFDMQMVSTGKGRTTCSYFLPDNSFIYASTHLKMDTCPAVPDWRKTGKYLWALYPEFEIFRADKKGKIVYQYTDNNFYDAEATVSPDGKKIVFTSDRSGDIELYTMNIDGSDLRQITNELGYDGGAFFSPDSKQIVFRASRPQSSEEKAEYIELLTQHLVAPTNMEIYVCQADGSNLRQVTHLGKANWAPFFHPNGKKIIFASNHTSQRGFQFNLYMINVDGTGLERITYDTRFDAFPMFSPDGKKIVFASNRNNNGTRDTNIFIADWVE